MKHNHGPNFGVIVAGCPRCAELQAKPYVLVYKLDSHKTVQRVPVSGVREATEIIQNQLPAVSLRVPIVETPSGETVAILKIS